MQCAGKAATMTDDETRATIMRWRKGERERLIAARIAAAAAQRQSWSASIAEGLDLAIGRVDGLIVSA